ncbi:MAG: undecaprenyl-diphosphate phosphatase [Candidatus Bathyarchaeia archaeon]
MLSFVESMILGIIQGLTEWLPISSSGHLAAIQKLFGWYPPVLFHVLLHMGTLFVIAAFFRSDIAGVLQAFARRDLKSEEGRLGVFIVVGSVPTAAIGFVFKDLFESFFDNLLVVGSGLLVTGVLLVISQRKESKKALSYLDALLVGTAQGIAIIPGVSRSGATISTGLLRGVDRETVFKFSFLLSIPAVLGATLVESGDFSLLASGVDVAAIVVGVTLSMVVGYFSLKVMRKIIVKQKLHWFAPYCWMVGALLVGSQIFLA